MDQEIVYNFTTIQYKKGSPKIAYNPFKINLNGII